MDDSGFKKASRRLVLEEIVVVALSVGPSLSAGQSSSEAWRFIGRHPSLVLHVSVGALILVEAVVLTVRSLRARQVAWISLALLGLAAVVVAGIGGERTAATQTNAAVDLMGTAWFVALVVYAVAWYLGRRRQRSAHRPGRQDSAPAAR